jgi:dTDP-L-rhamnose 4-epimerase
VRILVTGGLGFIGQHLVRRLLRDGHDVVIVDNISPAVHAAIPPVPEGARLVVGDVKDGELVRQLVGEPVTLVHLAARTGVGQSMYQAREYASTNCVGTATVLDTLVASGDVTRVVLPSSRAVYGEGAYRCDNGHTFTALPRTRPALEAGRWDQSCVRCQASAESVRTTEATELSPGSVYSGTKLFQEHVCGSIAMASNIPCMILRLFNVYGPGQSLTNPYTGILGAFARAGRRRDPSNVFEDGMMIRDFIHVDDVVSALLLAIGTPRPPIDQPTVVNVGTGEPVSILDVAWQMARLQDAPEPVITKEYRVGDVRHCYADTDRAADLLGFRARVGLETGLADYLAWFVEQPTVPVDDGLAEMRERGYAGRGPA